MFLSNVRGSVSFLSKTISPLSKMKHFLCWFLFRVARALGLKKNYSYDTEAKIMNEIGLRYNQKIEANPESKEAIKGAVFSMLTFIDNCWVGEYTPPNMKLSFNGYKKKYSWHDMFLANVNGEGNFEYIRTGC